VCAECTVRTLGTYRHATIQTRGTIRITYFGQPVGFENPCDYLRTSTQATLLSEGSRSGDWAHVGLAGSMLQSVSDSTGIEPETDMSGVYPLY
jgi:hypothetical protein